MHTRGTAGHLHDVSTGVAVLLLDLLRNLHGQVPRHRLTPLPGKHPRALAGTVLDGKYIDHHAPIGKLQSESYGVPSRLAHQRRQIMDKADSAKLCVQQARLHPGLY